MASTVPLESLLDAIPAEKRYLLNHKLEDDTHLAVIARSISDWPIVLPFLPNLKSNDAEAIEYNHRLSYEQQKMALLRLWRERNGPWATYRQLAESLHKAGKISAVQTLCEQLGAPANTTLPAPPHPASQPQQAPARQLPEPTMRDLVKMVHTTKPYDLGLELNINENDLDLVRANNRNDLQEQLREVLQLYRRQTVHPSWQQVASALQAIGEDNNAATIAEKYGFTLPHKFGTQLPSQGAFIPPPAAIPSTTTAPLMYPYPYPYPTPGTHPYWVQYHPYPPPQQPVGGGAPPSGAVQQWGHPGIAPSGPGVVSHPYPQPHPHPPVATGVHASSAPTTTTTPPAAHQPPTQTPAGHEVQRKKRDERLDLTTLEKFPHFSREINIMQEVVPRYKQLGNILLKSPNGNRVLAIEMNHPHNVNDVVYEIFQKWLVEGIDTTWDKLVQYLKDAGLNPLAQEIESCLF